METLIYQAHAPVATLTLNRPHALNALNQAMVSELGEATALAMHDPAVRVLLINAAGDHFMAGGDLTWFREQLSLTPTQRLTRFDAIIAAVQASILRLKTMPKPVVCAVHGAVAGFGMSLMLACDLVVAADNAYFTLAYCNIGLSPDGGSTWSLPRQVGLKQAMEIALLGDRLTAKRALALGLVNRLVSADTLAGEAQILVERLASGPTQVLARTKQLLNQSLETALATQLLAEQHAFANCGAEAAFDEGLAAFFARRPPDFSRTPDGDAD
ncbi:MAG TPA: enoyl-CoA hydratase-related protein [Accumulibacter sp.]|mgnify:CR=1 FL=1|nr:enoyl-CoA hydratase-related protein [Accumulibacter sp.]